MQLTITLFGKLSDSIGREVCLDHDTGTVTVAELRRALADKYPAAAADVLSPRLRAFVNNEVVDEVRVIVAGDEVALLPPVSGG